MKLISKYKDYYDYLVGIYGIDEKLAYDRRFPRIVVESDVYSSELEPVNAKFFICNTIFSFWKYKGKWHHTPEELDEMNRLYNNTRTRSVYGTGWMRDSKNFYNEKFRYTEVNINSRQPVLISGHMSLGEPVYECKREIRYGVPMLKDFPLPKYLNAESIYQAITGFLGWLNDNPEIPNKQTNEEKILSHGFDIKNSFRPNIKK